MSDLSILYNDVLIATPCDERWADMDGDDQRRMCGACAQPVYNLENMHAAEIVDLIERTEGQFCRRIYLRDDGTILTADCPVGLARIARNAKRRVLLMTAFAVSAAAWVTSFVLFGEPHAPEVVGGETPVAKVLEKIEAVTPPPVPKVQPEPLGGEPPPPPKLRPRRHYAGTPPPAKR